MKQILATCLMAGLLSGSALADIYIFNTTNDRFTYEMTLPNGDTKTGEIEAERGYGPAQSDFSSGGQKTHFKVFQEDGSLLAEETATDYRTFIICDKSGTMKMERASWYQDNGQTHKRVIEFFNATDKPLTFDLIDEKEVGKGLTLQPGERQTYEAKNGFNGSSGYHDLKFADGYRSNKEAAAGYFVILHTDTRYPGQIKVTNSGHVTPPRGKSD